VLNFTITAMASLILCGDTAAYYMHSSRGHPKLVQYSSCYSKVVDSKSYVDNINSYKTGADLAGACRSLGSLNFWGEV